MAADLVRKRAECSSGSTVALLHTPSASLVPVAGFGVGLGVGFGGAAG